MATLQSLTISDIGFLRLPIGSTAERPNPSTSSYLRYNNSLNKFEFSNGIDWNDSLYEFSNFTFTRGTATGRTGPSLANLLANYDTASNPWLNNTNFFNASGGIQRWTVPTSGWYTVEARGARGGDGPSGSGSSTIPGYGAIIRADFYLIKGTVYKILIGQIASPEQGESAGGGGGTFMWTADTTIPLIIAGGGGGAGDNDNTGGENGVNANTGTSGTAISNGSRAGGTNGQGGLASDTSGAGAGFLGNGANGGLAPGGTAIILGGVGGDSNDDGGFGGGGSENATGDGEGAGGGGGYSGGSAGDSSGDEGGGGGGSFILAGARNVATSNGSWSITNQEPHPVYAGTASNIGSYNNGQGQLTVTRL